MEAVEHIEKERNSNQRNERRQAECCFHSRASPQTLDMLNHDCADLVRDILKSINHFLKMIVYLGANHESDCVRSRKKQFSAAPVVQLITMLLNPDDLLGEEIQAACL